MNHYVPDFDIEIDGDEYPIPTASGFTRLKKPSISMPDDDIMELLWQNGQVVMQCQNQRPLKKSPAARYVTDSSIQAGPSTARETRSSPHQEVENYYNRNPWQEDEVASWLHYSIIDDSPLDHNFCADVLYPPSTVNSNNGSMQTPVRASQVTELRQPSGPVVAPRPPVPPARTTELAHTRLQNFAQFSMHNANVEAGPSSSKNVMMESTVVDSSETPAIRAGISRISDTVGSLADPTYAETGWGSMSTGGVAVPSTTSAGEGTGGRDATTCDMTASSSQDGSSGNNEGARTAVAGDRKRKGREREESECQSEDMDFECGEAKKQVRGLTSTKTARAAEVHNLSERRRRDRINEKMRALQELIPRCNKSDKASMLDEAIEYLKSLQLQVQMMSMGCGMVPVMFPGVEQYMASPMGMGLGVGIGMNRPPVMPFSNILAAPPPATAHFGPRFPFPPFQVAPHVAPSADSSRVVQAAAAATSSQSDAMVNSIIRAPDPNQYSRIPNLADPYQQYLGPHQMPFHYIQNQEINQPNVSKPSSSSRSKENLENHHPG